MLVLSYFAAVNRSTRTVLPILYGENVFTSTYYNGFELKLVKPHIRRRFGFSAGNIDSIRHI